MDTERTGRDLPEDASPAPGDDGHEERAGRAPLAARPLDLPRPNRIRLDRRSLIAAGAATGVSATVGTLGLARAQETSPATPPTTVEGGIDQVATVTADQNEMGQMAATGAVPGGYQWFVPFQASIVRAAAARLIPTDDLGPGATEAGVVYFIDRQLYDSRTAANGYRGWRYATGPFQPGEVTQGDQTALSMSEQFRLGILGMEAFSQNRFGDGFVRLEPDQQDEVLRAMENGEAEPFGGASLVAPPAVTAPEGMAPEPAAQTGISGKAFFELLLAYTIAGFFADPVHGGNRDMVGWKMIGFPGAQMGYGNEILNYGVPYEGSYRSIADYQSDISGGA